MHTRLRSMTLGQRISLGFAALIATTFILGVVCIVSMSKVSVTAGRLAEQYVPEVEFSSELGRDTQLTMLAVRSYALTGEEKYFEEATKEFQLIEASLTKGRDLVARFPQLTTLKQQLTDYETFYAQYKQLVTETKTASDAIESARKSMDAAATEFVSAMNDFQDNQIAALNKDIAAGAERTTLEERTLKVDTAAEIRNLVNQVRVASFKAQATRDLKPIEEALKNFAVIQGHLERIRPVVRQATNIAQLAKVGTAVKTYEESTRGLNTQWAQLDAIGVRRAKVSDELVAKTSAVVDAGVKHTVSLSQEAAASLTASSRITQIGLALAAAVGVILALLITRGITRTLRGIAESLADGAVQTSSAAAQVSAASQSLAEGASEQAASLEETSASLEELSSMTKKNAD
ncbi:MAG: hypothetical protein IT580_16545, partial [Verrucomicrobiales bacterium]|nr:hypothetical protein [Verrucomicrobiales bacterium]